MIDLAQLIACTGAQPVTAGPWLAPINEVMAKYRVNSPTRMAAFLAELGHESGNLECARENLNYTPEALMKTFNQKIVRFSAVSATTYGRTADHPADQRAIANIAYGGRMGNGLRDTGEGWKFRGGGPMQLTGHAAYQKCGLAIGVDLVSNPELIERPDIGAASAGWYWDVGNPTGRSLNTLADGGDIDAITHAINTGNLGATERRIAYQHNLQILRG